MDIYTAYERAYKNGFDDGAASKIVHGFWKEQHGTEYCSVCGKSKFEGLNAEIYEYWDIPFCPHCGAKMIDF